jgi:hypothetical protein
MIADHPASSPRESDRWRYFTSRQVREAIAWARDGGIAVHENIYPSRGRRTAHLLAPDEATLVAAARSIGCRAHWIQRTRTLHFDLVQGSLDAGLRRCGVDPTVSPGILRRAVWGGRGR